MLERLASPLFATMAEGTMFCTGHTSMNINELVSYSALIKKEFIEEYKMVHGLAVKKGPGRAKVDPLAPSPSPSPSPSPCTSPSTHTRRPPINPLARPLATDARLGGGEAGPDPSARHGLRGRQGVPWGQTAAVQQAHV